MNQLPELDAQQIQLLQACRTERIKGIIKKFATFANRMAKAGGSCPREGKLRLRYLANKWKAIDEVDGDLELDLFLLKNKGKL